LEIAVTALSIHTTQVHVNLTEYPFADLNLALDTLDLEINYALSTSYGFGGHNSAVLLKNYKMAEKNL
ncbi:beta-ketoacyl-[acyl-carrier-protein] synthase family protein, partial [bacterium]|nr:beta-ketoacyl-[acyl-carrier-protein] synthase family protein [bacterium]